MNLLPMVFGVLVGLYFHGDLQSLALIVPMCFARAPTCEASLPLVNQTYLQNVVLARIPATAGIILGLLLTKELRTMLVFVIVLVVTLLSYKPEDLSVYDADYTQID